MNMGRACMKSTVLIHFWLQQLVLGMMISFSVFGAHQAIAQPAAAPAPVVPPQVVQTIIVYLQAAGLTEAATFLETAVRGNAISLPPQGATIFAPTNLAIQTSPGATNSNELIAYHVAIGGYTVPALTSFPVGKQLPTLLPNEHLVVTSNDPNNYLIDAQHVVLLDICRNTSSAATVSCYQVDGVFNATTWGTTSIVKPPTGSPSITPAPQPAAAAAAPTPTTAPPKSAPAPAPASTKGIPGGFVPATAPPPYVAPSGAPQSVAAPAPSSPVIPGVPSAANAPNVHIPASISTILMAGAMAATTLLIT